MPVSHPNCLTPSGSKNRIWLNQCPTSLWASNSPFFPLAMSRATF